MNYKLTYIDTNTYNQRCKIAHYYKADSLARRGGRYCRVFWNQSDLSASRTQ